MKLYVMRHGPAVKRGSTPDEFSRPLSSDGEQQTAAAARGLKRIGLPALRILSSPLSRALRTAELVAAELIPGSRPEVVDALASGAAPGEIRKAIKDADGDLLIVGHDPDFSALVSYFLMGDTQPFIDFSTAGVVALEFPNHAERGAATLRWYMRRRHLELLGATG